MATEIKTALIVGASRGLGHGLVHEYAKRGVTVTGTVRDTQHIDVLKSDAPGHVTWQLLDINDDNSVAHFIKNLAHPCYDLIFINAGVGGPEHKSASDATVGEIGSLFQTNSISPVRLAKKLTNVLNPEHGIVAFMSSILGSVQLAEGYSELYSASKAALNSLARSYAASVKGTKLTVISMHPGWVKTDLGGDSAPLDVQTSVSGMVEVLADYPGKGGHVYVDYRGKTLPW